MTKSSQTRGHERRDYRVSFMASTCYRITVRARSEHHAITLAKREWFEGDCDRFLPYQTEDNAWDAELCNAPRPA